MEYVEGRINDEIVSSSIVTNCDMDCPPSCQDEAECSNCCNCILGGASPTYQEDKCTCIIYPPVSKNIPSSLPIIAN